MFYEIHNEISQAIAREKQLKEWKREWKMDLIKTMNIDMLDLAGDWDTSLEQWDPVSWHGMTVLNEEK